MDWMLMPLRRYAQFSGRSRPKEFWLFVLFLFLALIVISALEIGLGLGTTTHYLERGPFGFSTSGYHSGGPLTALFALAMLIPYLAVAVRRLHDTDRSAWWLLIGLIPLIGGIILLIFLVSGGTRGPNRFGADPFDMATPGGAA